ncbi:MAG TPA: HWE histidine kinase domain-containing protein [Allosphingosinicella sp.]
MAGRYSRLVLCGLLVALGGSVAVGWMLGIEPLKSVLPGLATMKFNSAIGFIVAGVGIYAAGSPRPRSAAVAAGAFLILLGGLTLAEYAGGISLGLDELVVRDRGVLTGSGIPGRMSPLTAIAWLAIGASILLVARGKTAGAVTTGHFVSVGAGFVAFLAAAGYAFGAQAFWGIGFYTAMAIHTAVGLLVAAAAVLVTRTEDGWLSGFGEAPAARSLLVRLTPAALLLPLAFGFVILLGSGLGAYNAAFGFALFVPLTTVGLTAVALLLAKQARASERDAHLTASALQHSEERYRRIFEQASDLILTADLDQVINDCNPSAAAAVGLTRQQAIGRRISDFISDEDFDQTTRMLRQKLEAGGTTRYDVRVRSSSGDWLSWEINSGLTYAEDGTPVGLHVLGRDVTERKRAEEHQRLLLNELNHRVKNTLAVVQSIAHQTLRQGNVAAEVGAALEGRLAALSAAHNVLTRENWSSASMREIIGDAVAPFCSDNRCRIEGPELRLNPRAAVSLALAVHELATNASKYGGLSNDEGHVEVQWRAEGDRLSFTWRESGGPKVVPPSKRGFGTRMIERGLASDLDGVVTLDFNPAGLVFTVLCPLPEAV